MSAIDLYEIEIGATILNAGGPVCRSFSEPSLTPLFVALVLIYLPARVLFIAGFIVAVTLFVMLFEEPHLRRTFGINYDNYFSRVHRWLPTSGTGLKK